MGLNLKTGELLQWSKSCLFLAYKHFLLLLVLLCLSGYFFAQWIKAGIIISHRLQKRYAKTRWLLLFIMVLVLLVPAYSLASLSNDKYDALIQKSAQRYLPGVPWQLYKAQLFQESRLDTCAVSPVGAQGLAQFMPATWVEVASKLSLNDATPRMASPAIEAGAYYMATLRNQWSTPRPEYDRHSLALASYNAGLGNLLKAQKLCDMATLYGDIVACLPSVTGSYSAETINYVPRIWSYYNQLMLERK